MTDEQINRAATAYAAFAASLQANGGLAPPDWATLAPAVRAAWVDACEAARADAPPASPTVVAASLHLNQHHPHHDNQPPPSVAAIKHPELPPRPAPMQQPS